MEYYSAIPVAIHLACSCCIHRNETGKSGRSASHQFRAVGKCQVAEPFGGLISEVHSCRRIYCCIVTTSTILVGHFPLLSRLLPREHYLLVIRVVAYHVVGASSTRHGTLGTSVLEKPR